MMIASVDGYTVWQQFIINAASRRSKKRAPSEIRYESPHTEMYENDDLVIMAFATIDV